MFDLLQMHDGAVHDPIKSLFELDSGRDVETVIVDGQVGRRCAGVSTTGRRLRSRALQWAFRALNAPGPINREEAPCAPDPL